MNSSHMGRAALPRAHFQKTPSGADSASNFRSQLDAAAPIDRRDLLTLHVRAAVARVIGLDSAESVDVQRGLFEAGLDSLASMELRNQLQASLGCTLSSTLTMIYPNIDALVTHLAVDVLGFEAAAEQTRPGIETNSMAPPVRSTAPREDSLDLRIAKELEALESLLN